MSTILDKVHSTNTIIGLQNQLNAQLGLVDVDLNYTLNAASHRNVGPAVTPTVSVQMLYFGIGIGGAFTGTIDENLPIVPSTPYIPSAENMDLFTPIPIRMIPQTAIGGFDATDYRMRTEITINSIDYYQWWLKKIDISSASITVDQIDSSGAKTQYNFNANNLDPDPTVGDGNITGIGQRIDVSLAAECIIRHDEIAEYINYLHAGNMSFAVINELGFYTGEDFLDNIGTGNNIETAAAQLATHRCMSNISLSNAQSSISFPVILANGSSMVSGSYV